MWGKETFLHLERLSWGSWTGFAKLKTFCLKKKVKEHHVSSPEMEFGGIPKDCWFPLLARALCSESEQGETLVGHYSDSPLGVLLLQHFQHVTCWAVVGRQGWRLHSQFVITRVVGIELQMLVSVCGVSIKLSADAREGVQMKGEISSQFFNFYN